MVTVKSIGSTEICTPPKVYFYKTKHNSNYKIAMLMLSEARNTEKSRWNTTLPFLKDLEQLNNCSLFNYGPETST